MNKQKDILLGKKYKQSKINENVEKSRIIKEDRREYISISSRDSIKNQYYKEKINNVYKVNKSIKIINVKPFLILLVLLLIDKFKSQDINSYIIIKIKYTNSKIIGDSNYQYTKPSNTIKNYNGDAYKVKLEWSSAITNCNGLFYGCPND